MRYDSVLDMIGDTPLLRLDPAVHGVPDAQILLKLESANPFGSVKDRVAWALLRDHIGEIAEEGRVVLEASSGNTAKALQIIASMHGVGFRAFTNRVRVREVREMLTLLGTDVTEMPGLSECPDPTAPNDVFGVIGDLMDGEPGRYHHTSQYTNEDNLRAHYEQTGREIYRDVGPVDLLVGGLGTTGSTRGAATYLRERNPQTAVVGVVAAEGDFIPGIRSAAEMWEVGLFEPGFYDAITVVDSADAIVASLELATRHGVLAGPTTGAAYAATRERLLSESVAGSRRDGPVTAVVIACDRMEPYLSYFRHRRPDLFGAASDPATAEAAPMAAPEDVEAWIAAGEHVVVVDVRTALAFRAGHIPGAINLRDDLLEQILEAGMPFSEASRVVFACPTGDRSARFAARAAATGRQAYNLAGGVLGWRDSGRPLAGV
ncbi:pyridoxal-phosphate dependent enzyme [Nocardioides sp.]|uniref:pyridoxal-phosphate dependent enzyme n=1 Tax=Nocardioides sp. TaxID=35761 RepID=UPI0019AC25E3|nr:pyridoxal-phosphate dependent enzyme [Nocardioides sp.]MBC7275702.1 pyridoxal-phosphate dependent enzyme [Nocardioides sp.]